MNELITIEKDDLTNVIFELANFYHHFSIELNNNVARHINRAKLQTPGKGFFGIKVSYTSPSGYIKNNSSELRDLQKMFTRRKRLIKTYKSLHFSLYKRNDEEFERKKNIEEARLRVVVNDLQAILQYDFEFNLENA